MAPSNKHQPAPTESRQKSSPAQATVTAALVPPQVRVKGGAYEGIQYLVPREVAILRYVYEYLAKKLYYPTRSEISEAVLGAKGGGPTSPYVRRLIKFGYLTLANARGHRNLRLTKSGLQRLAIEGANIDPQLSLDLPTTT